MKFIKPSEISGKILTLIQESEQFVILVSPYVRISKWYKLTKKINAIKSKGIPIEFFIQKHDKNSDSVAELEKLNYKFTALPDIHCKLYLNEKNGIVTSMNLLSNSDINALEIGYVTETKQEYEELLDYCKKYLMIDFEIYITKKIESISTDWTDFICKTLSARLNEQIKANFEDGHLIITIGINRYECFIAYSKSYVLRISRIISNEELKHFQKLSDIVKGEIKYDIELISGKGEYDDSLWCTLKSNLESQHIENLIAEEKMIISERIIEFITAIDKSKMANNHGNRI
jgi:hypothetical protein